MSGDRRPLAAEVRIETTVGRRAGSLLGGWPWPGTTQNRAKEGPAQRADRKRRCRKSTTTSARTSSEVPGGEGRQGEAELVKGIRSTDKGSRSLLGDSEENPKDDYRARSPGFSLGMSVNAEGRRKPGRGSRKPRWRTRGEGCAPASGPGAEGKKFLLPCWKRIRQGREGDGLLSARRAAASGRPDGPRMKKRRRTRERSAGLLRTGEEEFADVTTLPRHARGGGRKRNLRTDQPPPGQDRARGRGRDVDGPSSRSATTAARCGDRLLGHW